MKTGIRLAPALRTIVALTSTLLLAVVVNGCVAESEPAVDVGEGAKVEPQAGPANCCEFGDWLCAKPKVKGGLTEFEYFVPLTCGNTEPQAAALCKAECAVPCTNTGWRTGC
jgi:hypothetical protein